jgi:uncharacterized protein YqhQ
MAKKKITNSEKKQRICSIGGEALLEGIMMRAPNGYAQVVRTPAGELDIKKKRQAALGADNWFLKLPMVRGTVRMLDSLIVGTKALFNSAEISATEDDPMYTPTKFDLFIEKHLGEKAMNFFMGISLVLAVILSVTLFFILPLGITKLAEWIIGTALNDLVRSLIEGVARILIFLGYMIAVSQMKDIKRVFMYHGAEHKTIHCYENFDELTVENVRKHSKHHPRCGTAFLFVVMIISVIIHWIMNMLLPDIGGIWEFLLRIATLPIIAGIAYEFNRFAGRHENWFVKILRAPDMAMQRFTTKEPTDDMIEVAIIALKEALTLDEAPDYSAKEPCGGCCPNCNADCVSSGSEDETEDDKT